MRYQQPAPVSNEDYSTDVQLLLLRTMLSDHEIFARSQNILKPDYFDDVLRPAAAFILQYTEEYSRVPSPDIVFAHTKTTINSFEHATQHSDWYLKTIEKFCRYRALEIAVLEGVELIQNGEGAKLEQLVKDAMTISLMTDLGTSYFLDPTTRLERLNNNDDFIATGWNVLDRKLGGGFTRGSLNIFAGGSGSGKSLFLQNLALNWALEGKNVVYITLELSEDLVALRLDSMLTGIGTKAVRCNVKDAALKITMTGKKGAGDLRVKKMSESGTTCNTIRAYLKEYEIKEGFKPDVILIDYLDLMHPNNSRIDVSNAFTKDKFVSEEMRAIATDWDCPLVTASQLNRQSVDAPEFDHSHIAGGISKINTADNLFGLATSVTMKERGEYRLQFLKCRSAACVGQTITMGYDPLSMRITDPKGDKGEEFDTEEQASDKNARMSDLRSSLQHTVSSQRGVVLEPQAAVAGSTVSQLAHPEHKTRSQIENERGASAPAQAGALRSNIADLIKKTRNGEN